MRSLNINISMHAGDRGSPRYPNAIDTDLTFCGTIFSCVPADSHVALKKVVSRTLFKLFTGDIS